MEQPQRSDSTTPRGAITVCELWRDRATGAFFFEIHGFVESDAHAKKLVCNVNGSPVRTFRAPYPREVVTFEKDKPGKGFITFAKCWDLTGQRCYVDILAEDETSQLQRIATLRSVFAPQATTIEQNELTDELEFWTREMTSKVHMDSTLAIAASPSRYRYYCPPQLVDFVEKYCPSLFGGQPIRALDVGSGPFSQLVGGTARGLFSVAAVDPLGPEYAALLEADPLFRQFPVKPVKGAGETLLDVYREGSFHIVYIGNALDHTRDPVLCIDNMRRLLKPNGILMVKFYENEGTTERWNGLHQHDLTMDGGRILRTDKFGDVTELVGPPRWEMVSAPNLDYTTTPGSTFVEVVFRRT